MIKEFVERWENEKENIKAILAEDRYFSYDDLVKIVIEKIS